MDEFESSREEADMHTAQELYSKFCVLLADNPGQAKSQLVAGIQVALRRARRDGYGIGVWASKSHTSDGATSGD